MVVVLIRLLFHFKLLTFGGTEAVAESLYSVMKSQQQGAAQSLECLAMRTKVDWYLTNTARAIPDTINKMASTYIRQKKEITIYFRH